MAIKWKAAGFSQVYLAKVWSAVTSDPEKAFAWEEARFSTELAAEWMKAGVQSPLVAMRLVRATTEELMVED